MTRQARKPLSNMEVEVMFEPNRLAASCLRQAYLRLIPPIRRRATASPVHPQEAEAADLPVKPRRVS